MSRETTQWLNTNVLRGFTDKRGRAWHYSESAQGVEPNHYPGAIPVADLYRRLFGWRAEPRPLYVETANGLTTVDGQVAWVRSDNDHVLGIHSDGYSGHQYGEWCVKNVETMVDESISVANAGLLKGGAIAWVQIETPDNIETPEGVTIRPFVMATTSFDGSIATTYKDGYTDTVCDNTRDAFLREKSNVYRVKHTRNSKFDVLTAREALNILHSNTEDFMAEIAALCAVDVSDAQWSKFVQAHAPIEDGAKGRGVTMAENKRAELTKMWNHDDRVSPWRNTAWGVVQAVNTYTHHMSIVRNANRFERNMMRAVTGGVATLDRDTLGTLQTVIGREIAPPARSEVLTVA